MPKDVYCEMRDKFFAMTRTAFCPLCGDTVRRTKGGRKITDPRGDDAVPTDPSSRAPRPQAAR